MMTRALGILFGYIREHPLKCPRSHYELECRLGTIDVCSSAFTAGYTVDELVVVERFLAALRASADSPGSSMEHTSTELYCLAYFDNGFRQRSRANPGVVKKTNVATVDFTTNRLKDVRLSLSVETTYEKSMTVPPSSMVVCQRHSFRTGGFQYDITKRTTQQRNKRDACLYPCTYHVELEVDTAEAKIGDIAAHLVAMLGSYYKDSSDRLVKLPPLRARFHRVVSTKPAFDVLKYVDGDSGASFNASPDSGV